MSHNEEVITAQTVDLTNCDEVPIHIPGLIQPHGILFALQEPNLEILQVSNNTFDFIGIHPQDLLKKNLQTLLDLEQINHIQKCLLEDFESVNPLEISIKTQNEIVIFDGIIHRFAGNLILELEPKKLKESINFF